jgi:hypothetical protein
MTRTSSDLAATPPRRCIDLFSITASSLPCRSSESASTSSRNTVPPSAAPAAALGARPSLLPSAPEALPVIVPSRFAVPRLARASLLVCLPPPLAARSPCSHRARPGTGPRFSPLLAFARPADCPPAALAGCRRGGRPARDRGAEAMLSGAPLRAGPLNRLSPSESSELSEVGPRG